MKPTELERMLESMSIEGLTNLSILINSLMKEKQAAQAESDLIDAYKRFRGLCPNHGASFHYVDNNGDAKEIDDVYELLDSFWEIC
jgi:hypothetical protein